MIAAGSLFTSCVTNTEPQGVKDLREAKADYLESLARLRDADAAKVKAEAAFQDAQTAWQNAVAKLKELEVEKTQAQNDADIAKIIAQAKIDAVNYEKLLAQAEAALQEALRDIAVKSKGLTTEEGKAITAYTTAYNDYISALEAFHKAEELVYDETLSFEDWLLTVKEDSAAQLAAIEYYTEEINNLPDSGNSYADSVKFADKQQKERLAVEYAKANIEKEWALYKSTEVNPAIKSFASDLVDWTAQNVALPAPFQMHYKAQLPDNRQIFEKLSRYINYGITLGNNVASASVQQVGNDGYKPFIQGMRVVEDVDGKYWLLADYYSAPQARYSIWGDNVSGIDETNTESLATVVEALRRELVVDSTKYGFDTTGMAAAVKAAEDDYAKTEAALKAGIKADTAVNAAKDAYKAALEAVAEKKEAYDAVKADYDANTAALFAAVDSFVGTWNRVANTTRPQFMAPPVTGQLNSQDSVDIFNALVDVIAARKDVFPNDKQYYYYYTLETTQSPYGPYFPPTYKAVKDSVEISPDSLKFSGIQRNWFNNQSLYGGRPSRGQQPVTWENATELTWLLAAAFQNKKDGFDGTFFFKDDVISYTTQPSMWGPTTTTVTIKPIEKDQFVEALSGTAVHDNLRNLFFDKYAYKSAKNAIVEVKTQELYLHPDVAAAIDAHNAAIEDANDANGALNDAVFKGYYCGVYGKYWGLTEKDLSQYLFDNSTSVIGISSSAEKSNPDVSAETSYDIDDLLYKHINKPYAQFINREQDSLEIVFKPETFTKLRNIVNFSRGFGYSKEKKTFSYGDVADVDVIGEKISPDHNEELTVVLKELSGNQGGKFEDQKAYFGQHLFTKVLFKEYVLANVSVGTQGTQESLAALKTVCDDIVKAYEKAIDKQSDDSQDFYKFIEGLVGKETLAYIYDGLDNALTKAVEYLPAYAQTTREKGDVLTAMCYDVINKIANKEITSKDALIAIFEDFMSGEFDFDGNLHIVNILKKFLGNGAAWKHLVESTGLTDNTGNNSNSTLVLSEKRINRRSYILAYEALQIGDAFSGEQFRTLLADVINNYLNALGIDISGNDGGDIIEKFIFGTVRALNEKEQVLQGNNMFKDSADDDDDDDDEPNVAMISVVVSTILNHVRENCDGIIFQLDKKYFTEWRTKWAEYDVAMAKYEAQLTAIDNADKAYEDYAKGIKHLYDIRNIFEKALAEATAKYAWDCAALEKVYAGFIDWTTLRYEEYQNYQKKTKLALEIAEQNLAQAKKAYDQVLANHKND